MGSDALALAIACNNPAFIATALQNRAVSIALGGVIIKIQSLLAGMYRFYNTPVA